MGSNFRNCIRYSFLSPSAIRVPLLPAALYHQFCAGSSGIADLIGWAAEKAGVPKRTLEVAIQRASPDLLNEHATNASGKTAASIIRYLLRMSSRATPFSMFSASSYFDWSDSSASEFKLLDPIVWLFPSRAEEYKSILGFQNDINFLRQKTLFRSSSCRAIAGRLYCDVETADYCIQQSVKMTSLIGELYGELDVPQAVSHIATQMSRRFNIDEERILQTIAILISKGFFNTSAIREFLQSQMPTIPRQVVNLRHGNEGMLNLTKEGHDAYTCLSSFEIKGSLSSQLARDAAALADILLRVNGPDQLNVNFSAYKREFMERYGPRQPVLLRDVIDTNLGLGLPSEVQSGPLIDERGRVQVLSAMLARGMQSGGIVECDDTLLADLTVNDQRPYPDSLDIVIAVLADSLDAIASARYFVQPGANPGCLGAGRHAARFAATDLRQSMRLEEAIRTNQHRLKPEMLQCEASCLPIKLRLLNVMPRSSALDTVVSDFVGLNNVSIEDIALVLDRDRLRIISISTERELYIHVNHMVNSRLLPRAYRALVEIQAGSMRRLRHFDWGPFSGVESLPRLIYGRLIISPRRWHPPAREFASDRDVHDWRQKAGVPQFISVGADDNRLVLDCNIGSHVSEFLRLARRTSGRLSVEETFNPEDVAWVPSNIGKHTGEVVVSLVREQETTSPMETKPAFGLLSEIKKDQMRAFSPGSDWLFFKVFCAGWLQDRFITEVIPDLLKSCSSHIERWFFIRYSHPRPHLRLRLRVKQGEVGSAFLTSTRILENARKIGLCSEFGLDTYQAERARFGGALHHERAEEFFELDSRCVMKVIADAETTDSRQILGVTMTAIVLRALQIENPDAACFLSKLYERSPQGGDMFRRNKHAIRAAISNQGDIRAQKRIGFEEYGRDLVAHFACSGSWTELLKSFPQVLGDLLHLQCNRLLGTERQGERLHFELLGRAYDSLSKFQG